MHTNLITDDRRLTSKPDLYNFLFLLASANFTWTSLSAKSTRRETQAEPTVDLANEMALCADFEKFYYGID